MIKLNDYYFKILFRFIHLFLWDNQILELNRVVLNKYGRINVYKTTQRI